jgi:hypothetical protein
MGIGTAHPSPISVSASISGEKTTTTSPPHISRTGSAREKNNNNNHHYGFGDELI